MSNEPLAAKALSQSEEKKAKRQRNLTSKALLTAFLALYVIQLVNIRQTILRAQQLASSPVTFDEYQPDRAEYSPGDIAHFTYVRHCHPSEEQPLPILLLQLDSFENIDTGEVFQGTMASRIIKQAGDQKLIATRVLPEHMSPGRYVFEGWASSQVSRLSKATAYVSRQFIVKPRQK